MEYISAKELAKLAGVTEQAVSRARQQGRIEGIKKERYWFYLPEMAEYLNMAASEKDGEAGNLRDRLLLAKCRREEALAGIAELDLGERSGLLVNQEEVIHEWQDLLSKFRARILVIPNKLALELSGVSDPRAIEARLKSELYQALDELANPDNLEALPVS